MQVEKQSADEGIAIEIPNPTLRGGWEIGNNDNQGQAQQEEDDWIQSKVILFVWFGDECKISVTWEIG